MVVAPEGHCIVKRGLETETLNRSIDKKAGQMFPTTNAQTSDLLPDHLKKAVFTDGLLDMGIYNVLSLEDSKISENNFSGDSVPCDSFLILLD